MEEKSHAIVVEQLPLPPAIIHPKELSDFRFSSVDEWVDLARENVAENPLATSTQAAAGILAGVAVAVVSYRILKTRSVTSVLQSQSLAKDMTYLGVLYGAAECSQQALRGSMREARHSCSTSGDEGDPPSASSASAIMASVDVSGVKNVSLFGAGVAAPFFHFWYRFLDARFVGAAPKILLRKVALDQLVASSSVSALFLLFIPAFQGEPDLIGPESLLRQKFVSVYLTGCAFWPLMQSVNFRFVSPRYRVAYLGFAAFLWTNILCFYKH